MELFEFVAEMARKEDVVAGECQKKGDGSSD